MKRSYFYLIFGIFLLNACSFKYYQFFETSAVNAAIADDSKVEFQSDSIVFTYDLWSDEGDPGITILNNSSENLVIDLKNSFFIKNDLAIPFYDGKQISFSSSGAVSAATPVLDYTGYSVVGASLGSNATLTVPQEPYLIIPPGTYRVLAGFRLINRYQLVCDVDPYPARGRKSYKKFEPEESPFEFAILFLIPLGKKNKW